MKRIIFALSVAFAMISCSSDKEVECVCEYYVTVPTESGDTTYSSFGGYYTAEDGNCSQFNGKWENHNEVEERICEPKD
jgi:hypothetical protein